MPCAVVHDTTPGTARLGAWHHASCNVMHPWISDPSARAGLDCEAPFNLRVLPNLLSQIERPVNDVRRAPVGKLEHLDGEAHIPSDEDAAGERDRELGRIGVPFGDGLEQLFSGGRGLVAVLVTGDQRRLFGATRYQLPP